MSTTQEPRTGKVHLVTGAHHTKWDNSLPPAVRIESGDTVILECREPADGQFTPDSTVETLETLNFDRIHSLSGPVFLEGAEPGDALSVEILEFVHQGWAWTMIHPGLGILHEEFGETRVLKIWKVGEDGRASFREGVRVPLEPFCGVMGVALADPGAHNTLPPRRVGGNMDIRHLCRGTVLQLPIEVPGALFSLGDCHLAQGDGEVCGTALEAPMTVTVRISLVKDGGLESPRFVTAGPTTSRVDGMGHLATTSIGLDLQGGAREAVRAMVDLLQSRYGLPREDAYVICSAAGDLKIPVPVLADGHQSVVSFHVPRSIFVG